MQLVMTLVNRAAESGQTELQVSRVPNNLCSDRGRAIKNFEADCDKTLQGRPRLACEFWHDHLRPLGFGLKGEVLEYPGECPAISASF